jgi:hypothetical protein
MGSTIAFPTSKPLPPPPEIADLTSEERDAWTWMTSGGGFDTHLVNLTPVLARLLLTRVGDNRKPKRGTIQRYAQMMTRRQWKLTHQGIGISTRFEVIDGQHRIYACIESGVTIEILIVRGVSQDAILVLDAGVGRTDTDSIRIHDPLGLKDLEQIEVSSAKRMMRSIRRSRRAPSREDLRAFILRHRPAIQLTYRALWQEGRIRNVTHAELVAVLARASYHTGREDLLAAAAFLATGKSGDQRFEPLLTLREWLLKATPRDLAPRYGKAERALRSFIDRTPLGAKRLVEAREELFPLAEEREQEAE